jgi:hypothetical protein
MNLDPGEAFQPGIETSPWPNKAPPRTGIPLPLTLSLTSGTTSSARGRPLPLAGDHARARRYFLLFNSRKCPAVSSSPRAYKSPWTSSPVSPSFPHLRRRQAEEIYRRNSANPLQ